MAGIGGRGGIGGIGGNGGIGGMGGNGGKCGMGGNGGMKWPLEEGRVWGRGGGVV